MKRATRCLFRLLAAISALLLASCAIGWARSYRLTECVNCRFIARHENKWDSSEFGLASASGKLLLYRRQSLAFTAEDLTPRHGLSYLCAARSDAAAILPRYDPAKELFGFGHARDFWQPGSGCIVMPMWAPLLITAILPAFALLRFRRAYIARRRAERGLCAACGYDLRASTDRCPECGAAIIQAGPSAQRAPI